MIKVFVVVKGERCSLESATTHLVEGLKEKLCRSFYYSIESKVENLVCQSHPHHKETEITIDMETVPGKIHIHNHCCQDHLDCIESELG